MAFLPTLRRAVGVRQQQTESKAMATFGQYYASVGGVDRHYLTRDWPIERAVTEGFDRVMWVFKSVNTIAADSARLPFRLRDGIADDAPVVEDHPLYRLLNKKANPLENGQVLRKRLSAQILLSKRGAFVEVTRSNRGTPMRLDLLPPDRVEIVPGTGEELIKHYLLHRTRGGPRELDPADVRWFRDPHPLDPYSGVTPLESAGLSVELDHFARMYNVAFLRNDGRPGGVLAVRKTDGSGGDIDPVQMDRIEARFGHGPQEAGKLSVIAGDLSYVDLAASPRDMAYGTLAANSKIEILSAFGMSETVLGWSGGKTFANGDAELYNYWTRTMPAHNEILLAGFDEDSDDDLYGFLDTSKVEILERSAKEKRAEMREEVGAGLRSILNYAEAANIDGIESTPHTRALYIASGKTPLPSSDADAEALGLGAPIDTGAAPGGDAPPGELPPGQDPDGPAALPAPGGPGAAPGAPEDPEADPDAVPAATGTEGPARAALRAVAGKSTLHAIEGGRPKVRAAYRLERKAAATDQVTETVPDEGVALALEAEIAATLDVLVDRWTDRAVLRLQSPKQRKGTRHWTPEYDTDLRVGTKALDTAKAVDETTWQSEAERDLSPIVQAAAVAAAIVVLTDLAVTPPPGYTLARMAADAVTTTVRSVVTGIGRAAFNQATRLVAEVNRLDQSGEPIETIVSAVRDRKARLAGWAQGVAIQAATATTNGARDDGAREANRDENVAIERVWISRRDDRVRASHVEADGQSRGLDDPFVVGGSLLRHPGDPLAPLSETAGCRCRLRHRSRRTGRFVAPQVKALLARDGDGDGFVYDGTLRERPATATTGEGPPPHRAATVEEVRAFIEAEFADQAYMITYRQGRGSVSDAVMLSTDPYAGGSTQVQGMQRAKMFKHLMANGWNVSWLDPLQAMQVRPPLQPGQMYTVLAKAKGHRGRAYRVAGEWVLKDHKRATVGRIWRTTDRQYRVALDGLPDNPRTYRSLTQARRAAEWAAWRTSGPQGKALPRDGDGDGWVWDGTPRQAPAPLRLARGNDAAIARGAERIRAHAAAAEAWDGITLAEVDDVEGPEYAYAAQATFDTTFTTSTGRVVRAKVDVTDPNDANRDDDDGDPVTLVTVMGTFTDVDTDTDVGVFHRDIVVEGNRVEVSHSGLTVEPEAQGEGIAAEFNAHAMAWYRRMGVSRVNIVAQGTRSQAAYTRAAEPVLETGGTFDLMDLLNTQSKRPSNGGYTWGQQGYDFISPTTFVSTLPGSIALRAMLMPELATDVDRWDEMDADDQDYLIERIDLDLDRIIPGSWWDDPFNRADFKALMALDNRNPPTPFELNQVGRGRPFTDLDTGQETWLGKSLMSRSTWTGYFDMSWLDTHLQTKSRRARIRQAALASMMLASLGSDDDHIEDDTGAGVKSVRTWASVIAQGAAVLEARGDLPRDGDGDGFVYDGTPRQRPVAPSARGSIGRPFAETQRRERDRAARAAARDAERTRAADAAAARAARRAAEGPDERYIIRPDDPMPGGAAGSAESDAAPLAASVRNLLGDRGADPGLADVLVLRARQYDAALASEDSTAAAAALAGLLGVLARLRDLRTPSGGPLLDQVDLGRGYARLADLSIPTGTKSRHTTQQSKVRDGDGDGMVYDGTPRQRPATPSESALSLEPEPRDPSKSLMAKGAARLSRWLASAAAYDGPRFPEGFTAFKPIPYFDPDAGRMITPDGPPDMTAEEITAMARAIFEVEFTARSGRKVEIEVNDVDYNPRRATVAGTIRDGDTGEVIGKFSRFLDNTFQVEHDSLVIVPDARGEGIGAEFNAHAMAFYRELGIRRITLTAGGTMNQSADDAMNGGYVWATQGFDFAPPAIAPDKPVITKSNLANVVAAAKGSGSRPLDDLLAWNAKMPEEWLTAENLAWASDALSMIDLADPPTPYEMAMMGVDRPFVDPQTGQPSWFGKALMSRTTWSGYFDLAWLDGFEAKTLGGAARAGVLRDLMLTALGDDGIADVEVTGEPAPEHPEGKALPRDGDGDGMVHDGTPRQRPIDPITPSTSLRRVPGGYVTPDGEHYLERQARMSGGGTNGWAIHTRVPDEYVGRDSARLYDTRSGQPLVEARGTLYVHTGDEPSLGAARAAIGTGPAPVDHRAQGRTAAADRFAALTSDQQRAALTQVETAIASMGPGPERDTLEGAADWLRSTVGSTRP